MITPLLTLLALAAALLGVLWLPDPATRLQGAGLAAAGVLLAVVAFRRIEQDWPRPDRRESGEWALTEKPVRRGIAAALLVVGLALTAWALIDIWGQPFVWDQAWRWQGGLLLSLLGLALLGGILPPSEPAPPPELDPAPELTPTALIPPPDSSPPLIGPRPSGYKLRALGLDESPPDDSGPTTIAATPLEITEPVQPVRPAGYEAHIPRWLEAVLLIVILLAALWFRVYRLDSMPPGIFIDETNTALDALRILEGRPDSLFGTGWFETPNGFTYLQTLFVRLFGVTFLSIKLQSLLPGILTILALYFLAKELFGTRPALFAAAFLAFNRWHFNMSRWGWNEVYPPLMQVLALLFILRGARRRSLPDWALAGFLLGLGMYSYLAIRLSVIAIGLYLLYRMLVERGFLRRNLAGMAVFGVIYVLTFAPLGFTYAKDPFTLLNRSRQVSIQNNIDAAGDLQPLWDSASSHLQMFHVAGDRNPRHNLPGAPMLDPITGAFMLLGAGWALWRWRHHRHGLLLIWIPVVLLGGILSLLNEAPQAYRVLAVTPAVALLAADAFDLSLRALLWPARRYKLWRWWWGAVALVGLITAGWLNYDTYFHKQADDPNVFTAFSPLETAVAQEVLQKRDDHRLYLSPRLYYFSPLRYFAYQPSRPVGFRLGSRQYSPFDELGGGLEDPGYRLADPALDLPLPDLGGDNALFLLDIHFQHVLDLFRYYYPGTEAEIVNDRLGRPLYLAVTIPGPEITALQAANRAAQVAEMRGLYIPASGEYELLSPEPGRILLDGRPLDPGFHFLGQGLHSLDLSALPADLAADAPVLSWQGPGLSGPVPDAHLFRVAPSGNGLLGTYYLGDIWAEPPFMQRLDPLILNAWPDPEPIFGPFSVTWTGEILLPADGAYQFTLNADDGVRFWLDGAVQGQSLNPDTVNMITVNLGDLAAGPHPVRIDYFQRGGGKAMEFFWQPPGQPVIPVAPYYLRPNLW